MTNFEQEMINVLEQHVEAEMKGDQSANKLLKCVNT